MLRLLIDKAGDGHHDLFLKIDVMPSQLKVADSYYLPDFLELSEEDTEALKEDEYVAFMAKKLINYWIERINVLERGQKTFLLFDLSDQYVGGIDLEKTKRGFKLKFVYSIELEGYGVSISTMDKTIENKKVVMLPAKQSDWLISEEALFNGLNWSLEQLKTGEY